MVGKRLARQCGEALRHPPRAFPAVVFDDTYEDIHAISEEVMSLAEHGAGLAHTRGKTQIDLQGTAFGHDREASFTARFKVTTLTGEPS